MISISNLEAEVQAYKQKSLRNSKLGLPPPQKKNKAAWWYTPLTPVLWRQRQEEDGCELEGV